MNIAETTQIISNIFHSIAPEIDFNKIDKARPLRDQVEIDSFDFFRILVKINQQTGIYIPDSKIAEFTNLNQLIQYISAPPSPHQSQLPGQ